jgi:hypothetical protein
MLRIIILTSFTAVGLMACAPGYDAAISQRAAMRFDAELAGLIPGRPQSCLPPSSTATIVAARNGVLLFREGRMVYANATRGGCEEAADNRHTLVTKNFGGGSLCSGTFAQVVDLTANGSIQGACVLGDFTPYRRP